MTIKSSDDLESIKGTLLRIKTEAGEKIHGAKNKHDLKKLKVSYLGKKGEVKNVLSLLSTLPVKERAHIGKLANEVRMQLDELFSEREKSLLDELKNEKLKESIDISLPGRTQTVGTLHPITAVSLQIFKTLGQLGFKKAIGPQIEYDFYNFEALNIPKSHPARDMQDTFYIDDDVMLRTHTSPVQIRAMLAHKTPPLKIMSYGRVYRRDEDITHSPMFNQVEGLYVDEGVSLIDLTRTLNAFVTEIFSKDARIRMRPSFFPFTEPSMEVDVSCFSCKENADCRLCKGTGWIEILGAGMVDPEVFKACGVDSEKYTGFAFGIGIERIAMLKYQISDIRMFFENDIRFLKQFY